MSRAFVKELDGNDADAELPERALSDAPQYVTPRGLRKLHEELLALRGQHDALAALGDNMSATAQLKQIDRDLRYVEACVQNATVVVPPPVQSDVRFGAEVELLDEDGATHRFCIVGEHEACASTGLISWISPLARSLIGREVGDIIIWERPAGNVELEITKISYPDLS